MLSWIGNAVNSACFGDPGGKRPRVGPHFGRRSVN